MKILFMMKHPGSVRNFESTLRMLGERGHHVHLAFDTLNGGVGTAPIDELCDEIDGLSYGLAPTREHSFWGPIGRRMRLGLDYLRYLEPRYRDSGKLRERAEYLAPPSIRRLTRSRLVRNRLGLKLLSTVLRTVEKAMPPSPEVDTFIREQKPDILLVTPLIGLGSGQADYVRSALNLGVRTGLLVHSWDNLTNKGLMRDVPQLVTVWNNAQKAEAIELHGVPAGNVAVTGSNSYDHWFNWKPARERAAFCEEVGLQDDRPFILYLCSSPFIAPDEAEFVQVWAEHLRLGNSSTPPSDVGIVIRPHPQNAAQWRNVVFEPGSNVVVWPREGADPVDAGAKSDYFDSIYHCAAVVGINTSALIESAIVGRPVLTLLTEEYRETQGGTLHFQHLRQEGGGLLHVAETFPQHAAQIADVLQGRINDDDRQRRFLEAFVRPFGIDEPATPRLVEAVERAAAAPAPAARSASSGSAVRTLLLPAAVYAHWRERKRKEEKRRRNQHRKARAAKVREPLNDVKRVVRSLQDDPTVPILVGPWMSEVGYELLYWLPFLNRIVEERPELAERLVVVSRGGPRSWYRHLSDRYVDVFEHCTAEEFVHLRERSAAEGDGRQKQFSLSTAELELLDTIKGQLNIRDAAVLHPSAMYRIYWQLLKQDASRKFDREFRYVPMTPPDVGPLAGVLPDQYVAMRFYFNPSFPDTPENRAFIAAVLANLTQKSDVVLLNPAMRVDDHWDFECFASERIVRIDQHMTAANNLEIQTIAISRAKAFVGTYGGLSYLPPYLKVPSLCFYSDASRFRHQHLELAQRQFSGPDWAPFIALDTSHLDVIQLVLAGLLNSEKPRRELLAGSAELS